MMARHAPVAVIDAIATITPRLYATRHADFDAALFRHEMPLFYAAMPAVDDAFAAALRVIFRATLLIRLRFHALYAATRSFAITPAIRCAHGRYFCRFSAFACQRDDRDCRAMTLRLFISLSLRFDIFHMLSATADAFTSFRRHATRFLRLIDIYVGRATPLAAESRYAICSSYAMPIFCRCFHDGCPPRCF